MGSVWKRCTHEGKTKETGRQGVAACRCDRGSWWWRTDLPRDPTTRGRQQLNGHEPTKVRALEALREAEAGIDSGGVVDDRGLTVAQWLEKWLAAGTWKAKSRDSYAADVRLYLTPHLGEIRLKDLRRRHVRDLIAAMAGKGKSGHVCAKARRTLRAALSSAIADELLSTNPADGRITEIPRRPRTTGTVPEVAQLRRFINHTSDDPLHSLLVVDSFSGLRRGELLGVPWDMVSLTGGSLDDYPGIVIEQTVVERSGLQSCPVCAEGHRGRFLQRSTTQRPGAKSEASTGRWVPLTAEGVSALGKHKARQDAHRKEIGDLYHDHGLVWCDPDGSPMRPDRVTKRTKVLFAEAGLPAMTPKALRRAAATMLIEAGLPVELVAIALGQAGPQVTRDHYLRAMRGTLSTAAQDVARTVHGT